jgi:hypothetical protein
MAFSFQETAGAPVRAWLTSDVRQSIPMDNKLLFLTLLTVVAAGAPTTQGLPVDEVAVLRSHFSRPDLEVKPSTIVLAEKAAVSLTIEPGTDWKNKFRKSVRRADRPVAEAIEDFITKNSSEWSFAGLEISPLKVVTVAEAQAGFSGQSLESDCIAA